MNLEDMRLDGVGVHNAWLVYIERCLLACSDKDDARAFRIHKKNGLWALCVYSRTRSIPPSTSWMPPYHMRPHVRYMDGDNTICREGILRCPPFGPPTPCAYPPAMGKSIQETAERRRRRLLLLMCLPASRGCWYRPREEIEMNGQTRTNRTRY